MRAGWRRLGWLLRRPRLEREMEEEIRLHLEQETAERVAMGQDPAEARRTALRDFGRVAETKEDARAVRGAPGLENLARDLRLGVRALVRAPGAALVATVTLALAIGALTTVAAVVRGLLLTPLPYPEPGRLAVAWERMEGKDRPNVVSVANFEAWRDRTRSFTDLAGLVPDRRDLLAGRPERISGAAVSPAWFRVVGVAPALGRGFTEAEAIGDGAVIVLSDELWRDRFGADPAIVGRPVRFGDQSLLAIGVMPRGFEPPAFGWLGRGQRYWVPFAPSDDNRRWGRFLLVLGRLRPGVTVAQADGELAEVAAGLARESPADRSWAAFVRSLPDEVAGDLRPVLLALGVAAGALILAAGANLATMLLARARRRREELAVRLALGGTRARVARHLLIEAGLIGAVAGPAGWLLGLGAVSALAAAQLEVLPRPAAIRVGPPVVMAVGLAALMVVSLAALAATTAIPAGATRPWLSARGGGGGLRATRTLIVTEVAVAVLLTVVAGFAGRSFLALRDTRLGFSPDRVTALRISLPPGRYPAPAARAFFLGLEERLRAVPGVGKVGLTDYRPYHEAGPATRVARAGEPIDPAAAPVADLRVADAGYFEALRIAREPAAGPPLVEGVTINQTMARQLWADADPVGGRIRIGLNPLETVTVTGVVDDVRLHGPRVPVRGTIYFPIEGRPFSELDVLVRAEDATGVPALVRSVVGALDPTIAVYQVAALDQLVDAAVVGDRVASWTLSGFSVISLLLAAGGIAAVLLVELARRRRELGVRMALGASPAEVRRSVIGSALRMVVPGLALGAGGAAVVVPLIRAAVPGAKLGDPAVYLGGGFVLLAAVAVALVAPLRRATALDPVEILRGE